MNDALIYSMRLSIDRQRDRYWLDSVCFELKALHIVFCETKTGIFHCKRFGFLNKCKCE